MSTLQVALQATTYLALMTQAEKTVKTSHELRASDRSTLCIHGFRITLYFRVPNGYSLVHNGCLHNFRIHSVSQVVYTNIWDSLFQFFNYLPIKSLPNTENTNYCYLQFKLKYILLSSIYELS